MWGLGKTLASHGDTVLRSTLRSTPPRLCAGSDRILIVLLKRGIWPDVELVEIFVFDVVNLPNLTWMRPIS